MNWLLSYKKNEIMPFAVTWVDLEIKFSEVVWIWKDKYYMILLICGSLKKDADEFIYKTEIDL